MGEVSEIKVRKARVRTRAIAAVLSIIGILYLGYNHAPIRVPALDGVGERLAYTLRWQALSALMMLAGVLHVTRLRFKTRAVDPMSGEDAHLVDVHVRYLSNTFEQLFLSVFAQLLLTTYLASPQMRIIPCLVATFVIGRVAYWIGYLNPAHGRSDRSYGTIVTMLPTIFTYMYCVLRLLIG